MQPKVDHLAFVVKDLERSVKFYQDVFGGKAGRSRGFNEKDKNAGRPVHQLVTVGDYGFDLFVEDPADPPKPGARFLHFAFSIEPPRRLDEYLDLFQGPRRLRAGVLRQVSRRRKPSERDGALGRHLWGQGNKTV